MSEQITHNKFASWNNGPAFLGVISQVAGRGCQNPRREVISYRQGKYGGAVEALMMSLLNKLASAFFCHSNVQNIFSSSNLLSTLFGHLIQIGKTADEIFSFPIWSNLT